MTHDKPEPEEQEIVTEEELDKEHIWVRLTRPIKAYGDTVTIIKMRLPIGADAFRIGDPIDFNPFSDPPTVRFNMPILQNMIARLANIPSASLEKMAPQDVIACGWRLANFFLPPPGT